MKHKSKKEISEMTLGELVAEVDRVLQSQDEGSQEISKINKRIKQILNLPDDDCN